MTKGHSEPPRLLVEDKSGGEESGVGEKIMWLPKDERTLLAFCCTKVSRGEAPFNLTHKELAAELGNKGIDADRQLVHETLFKLQNRNLVHWGSCTDGNSVGITLSQQGYDLGRKYTSLRGTIAVWCTEYMWLFVVLGAIIGTVTLVVTIFKN